MVLFQKHPWERERRAIMVPSFSLTLGLRSRACAPVHAANNLGHSMKNTLRCYCWLVGDSSGLAFCLSVDHQPEGTTSWRLCLLYWGCVLLVDIDVLLSHSLSDSLKPSLQLSWKLTSLIRIAHQWASRIRLSPPPPTHLDPQGLRL